MINCRGSERRLNLKSHDHVGQTGKGSSVIQLMMAIPEHIGKGEACVHIVGIRGFHGGDGASGTLKHQF